MNKPYAESCDQNREPILCVIQPLLAENLCLLEIGSGTGQHAVFFAEHMPHLSWQTSDCEPYLEGINCWLREANCSNILPPIELDVSRSIWPDRMYDAVFSSNTTHIMHWPEVTDMFNGVGTVLSEGGKFLLYGPFNYNRQYTSASNERFDAWLKSRDPESGIRDVEDLQNIAQQSGLFLIEDFEMPANNRILYWQKVTVG